MTGRPLIAIVLLFYFHTAYSIWPQGVVHYSINNKDYDLHSQEEIMSSFSLIQREICLKFFNIPSNFNSSSHERILFINNPDRRKDCPPIDYDFTSKVVEMPIGYKCINDHDIARIVVDMLKASIKYKVSPMKSYLSRRSQEMVQAESQSSLLSSKDRLYINTYYHEECELFTSVAPAESRRVGHEFRPDTIELSELNVRYYEDKLWPEAVVWYGIEPHLRESPDHKILREIMTELEDVVSCILFVDIENAPKVTNVTNVTAIVWFDTYGEDLPQLGFKIGKQIVNLTSMTHGTPERDGHVLTNLIRILGMPQMSNRYDRDNYIIIHWKNIQKGKEYLFEREPLEAWLKQLPYDFNSVTHAPADFMCEDCSSGAQTVQPKQDFLWKKTLSMGRKAELSEFDQLNLQAMYRKQCRNRVKYKLNYSYLYNSTATDNNSSSVEYYEPGSHGGY